VQTVFALSICPTDTGFPEKYTRDAQAATV